MTICTPSRSPVDARIAAATAPGFPVVTRTSLRRHRVSSAAIRSRLRDGRLTRIWVDAFLVGVRVADAPRDLILAAAVMTGGPNAALDSASALERRGIWTRHDEIIHVATDVMHRPISSFHIEFHRRDNLVDRARPRRNGIPTRLALDALFAAAPNLTEYQVANVIKQGEYAREFTRADIIRERRRRAGHRGVATVARALELRSLGSAGTKSRSEDALVLHLVRACGEPLVNVIGAAGVGDYEPDFCWPDRRWIVEVDGDHHVDDPDQIRTDVQRDDALRSAGWIVVRIPYREVWRDLPGVLGRVQEAFAPEIRSSVHRTFSKRC